MTRTCLYSMWSHDGKKSVCRYSFFLFHFLGTMKKKKQKERKGTHTGLKSVVHQSVSGGPDSLISLQKHTFIPLLTYSTETGSYFMEKVFPLWESGSFLMDSSTRC